MNRTQILRDPGKVTFNSGTFYSGDGPITVDVIEELLVPEADAFGPLNPKGGDRRIEVKMPLVGQFEQLANLFPHAGTAIGTDIYGSTDVPLVVYGRTSGRTFTVHNAQVTGIPTLRLGHNRTLFGEVTFTGLLKKDAKPEDSAAYYTEASGSYGTDSTFDISEILTLGYAAAWGDTAPWDEFHTEGGWELSFGLDLAPKVADGFGTVGMTLNSVSVEASCVPIGPTAADILTARQLQGTGNHLGAAKTGEDLILTNMAGGSLVYVAVYNAMIGESQMRWGASQNKVGQTTWRAARTVTTGTLGNLFYLGADAPE